MRLLIAEDDKDIVKALTALFEHNHYSIDAVFNGNDAYDYATEGAYDGIILDIMMPGMDGLEVLKALRSAGVNSPVLLLTAKGEVEDRVCGLVSREFQMLQLLMQTPGVVISTEQFMERIWGWESNVEISIVWVYISNLRKKFDRLGAPVSIKAVRGVGYCLEKK